MLFVIADLSATRPLLRFICETFGELVADCGGEFETLIIVRKNKNLKILTLLWEIHFQDLRDYFLNHLALKMTLNAVYFLKNLIDSFLLHLEDR